MEVREIKTLLTLMQDYGLVELEIEDKKGKVRLVRAGSRDGVANSAPPAPGAVTVHQTPVKTAPQKTIAKAETGKSDKAPQLGENQQLVESPMVGTFYRAASPDAAPFVEEGDSVRKGQTLCIIEAMKMMNEIESPAGGRVVKILSDNGQPVEYGQPLMILEPG